MFPDIRNIQPEPLFLPARLWAALVGAFLAALVSALVSALVGALVGALLCLRLGGGALPKS